MSINHEIRIKALEHRVDALSEALAALMIDKKDPMSEGFYIKRGFQSRYDVYSGEQKVNDLPMSKVEAEKMATELNESF